MFAAVAQATGLLRIILSASAFTMPFTLAHPAAVLPLARSRLHFPALMLGSMAPDFIYFLYGRPVNGYGHTLVGCVLLNLPLVVLLYAIYRYAVADVFWRHVPDGLRVAPRVLRPECALCCRYFWAWRRILSGTALRIRERLSCRLCRGCRRMFRGSRSTNGCNTAAGCSGWRRLRFSGVMKRDVFRQPKAAYLRGRNGVFG